MAKDDEKKAKIMAYLEVFGTENGKIVLDDLKKSARYNTAYVFRGLDNHIDPLEMVRQEGKRSMIIQIETILKKDPNETKGIKND